MDVMNRLALLAFTSVAALCVPTLAEACSCEPLPGLLVPNDGAAGVPTNARVWRFDPFSYGRDAATLRLQAAGQAEIIAPGDETIVTGTGKRIVSYRPEQVLEPMTTYAVFDEDTDTRISTFTTGAGPVGNAPAVPSVQAVDTHAFWGAGGGCGSDAYYTASFDVVHEGVIVVMDLGRTATIGDAPHGDTTDASEATGFDLGNVPCEASWSDASAGAHAEVRFGSYDIAGNFSGWSASTQVQMESEPPRVDEDPAPMDAETGSDEAAGCSVGSRRASGLSWALSILGLWGLVRRRSWMVDVVRQLEYFPQADD